MKIVTTMPRHKTSATVYGPKIAQLRKERGWSQANFATYAKIGLATVQRAEASDPDLTYGSAAKLASALGVDVNEVYEASDAPSGSAGGAQPEWAVRLEAKIDQLLSYAKAQVGE